MDSKGEIIDGAAGTRPWVPAPVQLELRWSARATALVPDERERSNDQWLADLRGPGKEAALADLRGLPVRGLRVALHGRAGGVEISAEDFVHEALLRILDNLNSFRSESRLTVWAQKICVRTAFAEMRRSRWRDVSLEEVIDRSGEGAVAPADPLTDPEQATTKGMILANFRLFIGEDLTK